MFLGKGHSPRQAQLLSKPIQLKQNKIVPQVQIPQGLGSTQKHERRQKVEEVLQYHVQLLHQSVLERSLPPQGKGHCANCCLNHAL